MVFVSLVLFVLIILLGNYVIDDKKLVMDTTTKIVDEEGNIITRLFIENREKISLAVVPVHVQEAFVAVEDTRFYNHQGIDIRAIARALYRDIVAGAKVEGGSTITQQLAKNVFLTNDKTWLRKTKEVLIAMNLERRYSKNELLEMYLNRIYFGHEAYGIQAAASLYFNKGVNELTVEQGALLAGMVKAPNAYSPINHPDKSKQRRDVVLGAMEKRGNLTAEQVKRYRGRTLSIDVNRFTEEKSYLTYIDMVIDEAQLRYQFSNEELLTGGYTIVIPMKQSLQEHSYSLIRDNEYFPVDNQDAEAAFVLMDIESGGVLAAQGGRDYVRRGINRVNVKRQPGSVFKPLAVFAPALEEGAFHPYSLLRDERLDYAGYSPRNYNDTYAGEVTLYDAITHSLNAPTVWLLNEIGIDRSIKQLEGFELAIPDRGLALGLGGLQEGVTPLEMTKAYRAFAHEGKMIEPYFITAIYDQQGKWMAGVNQEEKEVISLQTAWNMTRMLEAVVQEGTGKSGNIDIPLAGKTGTTSYTGVKGGAKDAWFVGYTPSVVGAVWMGYDTTTSEQFLSGGSSYPTVLFKDILNGDQAIKREVSFQKPDGVDELSPPVRMTKIDDLTATLSMGGKGLMSVKLTWTGMNDTRVHYNVYEVYKGERQQLATVVGDHQFIVPRPNPFLTKTYEVVPYDSTTRRAGEASNQADVSFRFGFH
nr:PBP1A family penicillin-binding protein [Halalkalibacter urbisdiaboli]